MAVRVRRAVAASLLLIARPCDTVTAPWRWARTQPGRGGPVRAVQPLMSAGDEMAQPSALQRGLVAAITLPWVAHREPLPPLTRRLISPRARIILAFVLDYLSDQALDVDVHASGGYVRDLLLGRLSDDLDLSLCLVRCAPNVMVESIARGMPAFAASRPDLGVERVDVVTALSEAARAKGVDAATVRLAIGGAALNVDLMPTIKSETYDGTDRVPVRVGRGSAEEDSARRDLTCGSMLVHVTRPDRGRYAADAKAVALVADSGALPIVPVEAAAAAASDLNFRLLDYFGGVEDVSSRLLRCPLPLGRAVADVWEEVVVSDADRALARRLGLGNVERSDAGEGGAGGGEGGGGGGEGGGGGGGGGAPSSFVPSASAAEPPTPGGSASEEPLSDSERAALQALWWAKMLRDDPLRVVRALRFSAALSFRLHPSFYVAAPLALSGGVSGAPLSRTRALAEMRKAAGAGAPRLVRRNEPGRVPAV